MKRATSAILPLMVGMAAMCWHSISVAETIDGPRVHWNFAYWGKPRAQSVLYEKFAEFIEERTGGKFTMQIHWGTLTQPRDNLDGIKLGAYEGTHFVGSYYPGKLPAANVSAVYHLSATRRRLRRIFCASATRGGAGALGRALLHGRDHRTV